MKQIQLLKTLELAKFSGQLIQTESAGRQWNFYLLQGRLLYATGGEHSVRRWQRTVGVCCPQMAKHRFTWYFDLRNAAPEDLAMGWEYALLRSWVSKGKITEEQALHLIRSIATEVVFEVLQSVSTDEQIHKTATSILPLPSLDVEEVIQTAQEQYTAWQQANLASYTPTKAPIIRQPEQLQERVPTLYQTLNKLLNGQQTFYDLAIHMKREVSVVTASLVPCIERGWIELVSLPDFPVPMLRRDVPVTAQPIAVQSALIACVDDSALIRQMMEKLLTSAGYRFISISDPLRAIGTLLAKKPDLIFLDLMMPNASGHELCQQLRKLSCFQKTPIVILTGSDGFANRLQSNFAGASEFLSKPLDAETVLNVIHKHLEQSGSNLLAK